MEQINIRGHQRIENQRTEVGQMIDGQRTDIQRTEVQRTEERSYLTHSLEEIPLYRARNNSRFTDEQRMELILNELSLVGKEVENKQLETQSKSNFFRIINTISSLLIVLCASIIIGLQAAGDCINIAVIVLSSVVIGIETLQRLFRWGQLGVMYKNGTIQLKRISSQVREYMYFFNRYTDEQLLSIVSMLRSQYDDIDSGLYTSSISDTVKYNTGNLDTDGNSNPSVNSPVQSPHNVSFHTPSIVQRRDISDGNIQGSNNQTPTNESPHVHIHIDNMGSFSNNRTPVSSNGTPITPQIRLTPKIPFSQQLNTRIQNDVQNDVIVTIESDEDNDPPVDVRKK